MTLKPLADKVVVKRLEAEEKTKSGILLAASAQEKPEIFESGRAYIARLAWAGDVTVCRTLEDTAGMAGAVTNDAKLYMPMAELVDLEKERARIEKELARTREDLQRTETRLQNPGFVNKAPERVVAAEREKVEKAKALIANLEEGLAALGK